MESAEAALTSHGRRKRIGAAHEPSHMIEIIEFDFERRQERPITPGDLPAAMANGRYCWVDAEALSPEEAGTLFERLQLDPGLREEILGSDVEGRFDLHGNAVHFGISEAQWVGGRLELHHVDAVAGAFFLLTFHRGPVAFLGQMHRAYREDFLLHAESPGFLLYEIGDRLLDQHRRAIEGSADAVEKIQMTLFANANDAIFGEVAALSSDLNIFRRALLGARELLHELSTRRSPYISPKTQPYLGQMAGAMERLQGDLTAERDLLNETLNLYLGMVSHRTSRVVNRLTALSTIFLPLSFLCGVYGMNFDAIPELHWRYGYLFFWLLVLAAVASILLIMRRARWI